jgi:hypothetical protein
LKKVIKNLLVEKDVEDEAVDYDMLASGSDGRTLNEMFEDSDDDENTE